MHAASRSVSTSVSATADRPHLNLSSPGRAIRPLHVVHDQTHLQVHPLQLISSEGVATAFKQNTSGSIDAPTPDEILPESSDLQSPTVSDDNAALRSELELGPDPRAIVPVCYARAIALIRLASLDNRACKSVITALKVTGVQNANLVTKLNIWDLK